MLVSKEGHGNHGPPRMRNLKMRVRGVSRGEHLRCEQIRRTRIPTESGEG